MSNIKQRPDYEEIHYVEVMTLLSIHEENMELENSNQEPSSESEGESSHTMAVQKKKRMSRINTPSPES